MTTLKWFSFSVLLLLAGSCSQEEWKSNDEAQEVLIESTGYFRGYEMGWTTDSLLAHEKWTPVVSNDSTIQFHETVRLAEDSLLLDAYLTFDDYGLFEVQIDVFTQNDTLSEEIIENWSNKLTAPFGEPEDLITARRWTTFSESNNTVEITLSQERNRKNQKFISLNYLEPLDDEY